MSEFVVHATKGMIAGGLDLARLGQRKTANLHASSILDVFRPGHDPGFIVLADLLKAGEFDELLAGLLGMR